MVKMLFLVLVLGLVYGVSTVELPKNVRGKMHLRFPRKTDDGKESGRIVGGSYADRGEYPWLINLRYNGVFQCGGTILDENTILTAAHCVEDDPEQRYGDFSIKAGDYKTYEVEASEQLRKVKQVIMHEKYNAYIIDRDVAILKLEDPLKLKKYVQKIRLANKAQEKALLSRPRCLVAGIGDIDSQFGYTPVITQEVSASLQSRKVCLATAKEYIYGLKAKEYTRNMLCSLDLLSGACYGDSGGPLTCYDEDENPFQVGIVSWGLEDCYAGFNVYARVSYLKAWIKKHLE